MYVIKESKLVKVTVEDIMKNREAQWFRVHLHQVTKFEDRIIFIYASLFFQKLKGIYIHVDHIITFVWYFNILLRG